MQEWYKQKMIEAHAKKEYSERNNYAKAIGVDVIRFFYLNP